VRGVVVVVSGSRGGSTLLGSLLRRVPGLVHTNAELNPLFALAGLHDGADRRPALEAELLADLGRPHAGPVDDAARQRLALDLAWRLLVQWPDLASACPLPQLLAVTASAAATADRPVGALLAALAELSGRHPALDARRYDLPAEAGDLVAAQAAGRPAPIGPPGAAAVEMAPFVVPGWWTPASAWDLATRTVVLTTPRSAFRLPILRDLFPRARLRVVHLTRNPAASVNGLMDGWRHHGFATAPVPGRLRIAGYSDVVPGGDRWWCFDIPPDWADWADRPLAQVCAHQWAATHAAALDGAAALGLEVHRLPFEALVGPPAQRRPVLDDLAAFLAVDPRALREVAGGELPVVMATAPPRPGRWRAREAELTAALATPEAQTMAERLGCADPTTWT